MKLLFCRLSVILYLCCVCFGQQVYVDFDGSSHIDVNPQGSQSLNFQGNVLFRNYDSLTSDRDKLLSLTGPAFNFHFLRDWNLNFYELLTLPGSAGRQGYCFFTVSNRLFALLNGPGGAPLMYELSQTTGNFGTVANPTGILSPTTEARYFFNNIASNSFLTQVVWTPLSPGVPMVQFWKWSGSSFSAQQTMFSAAGFRYVTGMNYCPVTDGPSTTHFVFWCNSASLPISYSIFNTVSQTFSNITSFPTENCISSTCFTDGTSTYLSYLGTTGVRTYRYAGGSWSVYGSLASLDPQLNSDIAFTSFSDTDPATGQTRGFIVGGSGRINPANLFARVFFNNGTTFTLLQQIQTQYAVVGCKVFTVQGKSYLILATYDDSTIIISQTLLYRWNPRIARFDFIQTIQNAGADIIDWQWVNYANNFWIFGGDASQGKVYQF